MLCCCVACFAIPSIWRSAFLFRFCGGFIVGVGRGWMIFYREGGGRNRRDVYRRTMWDSLVDVLFGVLDYIDGYSQIGESEVNGGWKWGRSLLVGDLCEMNTLVKWLFLRKFWYFARNCRIFRQEYERQKNLGCSHITNIKINLYLLNSKYFYWAISDLSRDCFYIFFFIKNSTKSLLFFFEKYNLSAEIFPFK